MSVWGRNVSRRSSDWGNRRSPWSQDPAASEGTDRDDYDERRPPERRSRVLARRGDGGWLVADRDALDRDALDRAWAWGANSSSGWGRRAEAGRRGGALGSASRERAEEEAPESSRSIPSSPVLATMQSLLFSPRCSDIQFVCSEGTILHAHKCILAASSEYFATAIEGLWGSSAPAPHGRLKDDRGEGAEDSDGEGRSRGGKSEGADGVMVWPTSNSPHVMRAVLCFLYTGDIEDHARKLGPPEDVDPRALLSVAHEYGLRSLLEEAEDMCFRDLAAENWKETLQLAHLYECDALKVLCFNFCKDRTAEILSDPNVAALAAEDQELWEELREFLLPGSQRVARGSGGNNNGGSGAEVGKKSGGEQGKKKRKHAENAAGSV